MKKERKTMREEEKGDCREEGERMAGGGGEKRKLVLKGGCIKAGKRGPWLVHRTTKDGSVVTRFRYPSDRERQNNKRRERERRSVTQKIFQGLRAHGNYRLPKYSDSNDLLKALCDEAGWHVDEDGHVSRKSFTAKMTSFISGHTSCPVSIDGQVGYHEDYCQCDHDKFNAKVHELRCTFFPVATSRDQYDQIDLALSLQPSPS